MTYEQSNPQKQNLDPRQLGEVSLDWEINELRQNPAVGCEDLFSARNFSARKMESSEYPEKPGVRLALETPIETAVSGRSDVEQDLMAVVTLGKHVALGIVRGKDESGNEATYLSLLNNNPQDNEGRAKLIDVLRDDAPVAITRGRLEQVAGRDGAVPGVSGQHCTIELRDGVLTVVDEGSLNGTSVFTNSTKNRTRQFGSPYTWSQPSLETKQLIEGEQEAKRLSKISKLGRFTVNS